MQDAPSILDLATTLSPARFAQALAARGGVSWAEPEGFWLIADHELAEAALRRPELSADRRGFFEAQASRCPFARAANFLGLVKKMMVNSDGDEHAKRRALAQAGLDEAALSRFEVRLHATVERLLDGFAAPVDGEEPHSGCVRRGEFVSAVAVPLPNIVLADLFGICEEERGSFYAWANQMTQFFGGASGALAVEAADEGASRLRAHFARAIEVRREAPSDDFLGRILRKHPDANVDELVAQAAIVLIAGGVTSTDQICNSLAVLLQSGAWSQLEREPHRLNAAIEEATRLDPAVNFLFRAAREDFEFAGARIKQNQMVFISAHAANRDPAAFARPDDVSLDRARPAHLSFGSGSHYCLGARLGRMQMRVLFARLLARFPNLALDTAYPARRKRQSLGFSGYETLPLVWTAPRANGGKP